MCLVSDLLNLGENRVNIMSNINGFGNLNRNNNNNNNNYAGSNDQERLPILGIKKKS